VYSDRNLLVDWNHQKLLSEELKMKFIEMTGATLDAIINDDELLSQNLDDAGVNPDSIVRVNQQGDIEVRKESKWAVIGGLLGNFDERIKKITGFDWV
ncbi:MAG: hypothetical protein AAF623_18355, partial [Planctomycetota bacterium]